MTLNIQVDFIRGDSLIAMFNFAVVLSLIINMYMYQLQTTSLSTNVIFSMAAVNSILTKSPVFYSNAIFKPFIEDS